jgi:AcrR family transcriptional regulator
MKSRSGPRGAYAKSAERRAKIAQAALDVVREKGHRNLTTTEVAHRAGVGERSLFYHFPTRDHVLVAALELYDQQLEAERHQGNPADADRYDIDLVVAALASLEPQREWKVQLTVALSAQAQDPTHPAHDYFERHNAKAISEFTEMLRHRQSAGIAHPDLDPVAVARRLVAVWDGLQAQWLVTPTFDLGLEIHEAFRQLSGQNVMEVKQAIDSVLAEA